MYFNLNNYILFDKKKNNYILLFHFLSVGILFINELGFFIIDFEVNSVILYSIPHLIY